MQSRDGSASAEARERLARLIRTIEGEIVPRLLLSLSGSLTRVVAVSDRDAVDEFARLLGEILAREDCDYDQLLKSLSRLESVIREVSRGAQSS